MHIFNRILVILGLLAIMVISAILFLAWGPFLQLLIGMLQQVNSTLNAVAESDPLLRWAGGFGLTVLVWAACIGLLWLETRRPRARTITVQQVSGGHAELTVDSITSRLQYNLEQLPDIIHVWPRVRGARKGVRIDMAVETNPEVDVPAITEEIRQRTRDIMEQHMGLRMESIRVVIRHAPYPRSLPKGGRVEALSRPAASAARLATPPAVVPSADLSSSVTPPPLPSTEASPVQLATEPSPLAVPAVAEPSHVTSSASQADTDAGMGNDRERSSHQPWSFLRSRAEEVAPTSETSPLEEDESTAVAGSVTTPSHENQVEDKMF
ncbi:MAG: hypothetical protein RMK79_07565 [Anaerolineae bacterium]|nr:hypothetical protein [Anaerolineae bacterium]